MSKQALKPASDMQGFTIVELMITVLMVAIIAAIAAPDLSNFLQRKQIRQQASEISNAFSLARSTALSNGGGARVCWNTGEPVANAASSNSIVVVDVNNANNLLKTIDIQPQGFQVSATTVAGRCIDYDALGRASLGVSFGVCHRQSEARDILTVSVAATGRSSISRANPNNFTCSS